jgi:methylmalonyl-CoA/ethylmalonyl-CoA epimerase
MTTSRFEASAGPGLLGRLNHVGIAVADVDAALAGYRAMFGAGAVGEPFDLEAQGVRVCFVDAGSTEIELIAPLGDDSPLANFLARSPAGGQHHVCHEVADVEAARAAFAEMGVRALGEPRLGAHGTRVLFLHPKDMGGVLVELMEPPEDGR